MPPKKEGGSTALQANQYLVGLYDHLGQRGRAAQWRHDWGVLQLAGQPVRILLDDGGKLVQ